MKIQDFQDNVTCGGFDNIFANIYKPQDIESRKSRYMSAVEKFTALYPNRNDIHIYSAPGRTEIGGNHTDHQHGCVIAGAVDFDVIGVQHFMTKTSSELNQRDTMNLQFYWTIWMFISVKKVLLKLSEGLQLALRL